MLKECHLNKLKGDSKNELYVLWLLHEHICVLFCLFTHTNSLFQSLLVINVIEICSIVSGKESDVIPAVNFHAFHSLKTPCGCRGMYL